MFCSAATALVSSRFALSRTAVPFWGQTARNLLEWFCPLNGTAVEKKKNKFFFVFFQLYQNQSVLLVQEGRTARPRTGHKTYRAPQVRKEPRKKSSVLLILPLPNIASSQILSPVSPKRDCVANRVSSPQPREKQTCSRGN